MGCKSTKEMVDERPVEIRRRLSVGDAGALPKDDINYDGSSEEERAMLVELSSQAVLDLAANAKGRKLSIGSRTDAQMNLVASFKKKTVQSAGQKLDAAKDCIGYACMKGKKPESPNQDSFFIMKVEGEYSIYGVFDGHGRKGHDISNFIKDHLPRLILQDADLQLDPLNALTASFDKMQKLIVQATEAQVIDARQSGSTVSVIYHDHKKNYLHVAHVGDSRCVIGRNDLDAPKQKQWHSIDLTVDHKPDLPEERARIEAAGGRIVFDGGCNHRVYAKNHRGPGLNMSRAMGDLIGFYHAGISAVPDVQTREVQISDDATQKKADGTAPDTQNVEKDASRLSSSSTPSVASYALSQSDRFILLCSDGVWEFLSSDEAVNIVALFKKSDAMKAAEKLAKMSWDCWIKECDGQVVDDITALVINLAPKAPDADQTTTEIL